MGAEHFQKLKRAMHCPCCGSEWRAFDSDESRAYYYVRFACGAAFTTDDGDIKVAKLCPSPSDLAARLWNIEASGGA